MIARPDDTALRTAHGELFHHMKVLWVVQGAVAVLVEHHAVSVPYKRGTAHGAYFVTRQFFAAGNASLDQFLHGDVLAGRQQGAQFASFKRFHRAVLGNHR